MENPMNLTAAELRREYGKALAMVAKLATERDTLKAALERLTHEIEATGDHGDEGYDDTCPTCEAYRQARAALATCVPPQETAP